MRTDHDVLAGPALRYLSLGGRVLLSALFVLSGFGKVASPAATAGYIASADLPLATAGCSRLPPSS